MEIVVSPIKTAGLSTVGKMRLGDTILSLEDTSTFAVVDTTIGYHARETQWNWASFAGRAKEETVGLNLANPTHTENAFWINGTQHRVSPVGINIPDGDSPWTIRTTQTDPALGSVDLQFTPLTAVVKISTWSFFQVPLNNPVVSLMEVYERLQESLFS